MLNTWSCLCAVSRRAGAVPDGRVQRVKPGTQRKGAQNIVGSPRSAMIFSVGCMIALSALMGRLVVLLASLRSTMTTSFLAAFW